MRGTEVYKWVDITDELEQSEIALIEAGCRAVQYRLGPDVSSTLFTLVDMPSGKKKFVPGRAFCPGNHRVMIDYTADPENGIGAVYQRRPIVKWVDVTNECEVKLCKSGQSHGYYVRVLHDDVRVALLGIKGSARPFETPRDYKIEVDKDAHVSFRVLKKTTC